MSIAKWLLARKLAYNPPLPPVIKRVTGNPVEFSDGADAPLVKCVTEIQGSQDLHGYDKPWVGGAGKNKLPMTVSGIKGANTSGTWSGNEFNLNGITYTLITDNADNILGIKINGTATATSSIRLVDNFTANYQSNMILNGCPQGGSVSSYFLYFYDATDNVSRFIDTGSGANVDVSVINTHSVRIVFSVLTNATFNNVMLYPMLRLSTETDATFAPYSNICPITAYTEGEIEVRGKNRFKITASITTIGTTTFTVNTDGTITVNGTTSWNIYFEMGTAPYIADYPSETFYLSGCPSGGSSSSYGMDVAGANGYDYGAGKKVTFNSPPSNTKVRIFVAANYTMNNVVFRPMICLTSLTDKSFEPYKGTTHTTTFPSAIYRGSVDCVKGEVTTEWGMIASYAGETLPGEWISDRDEYAPGTTPTTGAQVAYALATPTTSSVTPTNLPIKSLSGYNHIESTTGEMVIDYITDQYQNFVDTVESALPNTRKGGVKAMDIFLSLEKKDDDKAEVEKEAVKEEVK